MKGIKLIVACLLLSLGSFSQTKDTVKTKQYVLVMTEKDITQLFEVLRTSAKYSSMDIESFIESISRRLTPLPEPPNKSSK